MPGPGPRFTSRLRLEPMGPGLADDMFRLHNDPDIAKWYGGAWTKDQAHQRVKAFGEGWTHHGVSSVPVTA